jgi:hypothetical protein
MAKTTFRKVNQQSWVNNTWLSPYYNCVVKLIEFKNEKRILVLDGRRYDVTGGFTAPNGWVYNIKQVLTRPLKNYGK